jgi:hypothetical protein
LGSQAGSQSTEEIKVPRLSAFEFGALPPPL